jgi:hypothetical protein
MRPLREVCGLSTSQPVRSDLKKPQAGKTMRMRKRNSDTPRFGEPKSAVVDGLAAYGRFTALTSAVGFTLLAVVGVFVGVFLARKGRHQLESVATATSPSTCHQERVRGGRTRSRVDRTCTTAVAYTAAGAPYRSTVETMGREYARGDKLSVYYDPGSAGAPSATRIPVVAGWLVIGGSVGLAALAWIRWLITREYKVAAAATGANQALGMLWQG